MIRFTVIGDPQPAGSKRAFIVQATICRTCGYKVEDAEKGLPNCPKCRQPRPRPRAAISDDNTRSKPWQYAVAACAREAHHDQLLTGPLRVTMVFYRPRPRGHYGSGANSGRLKPSAPLYPETKPDVLKLARGVEDALTRVVYTDDALIVEEHLSKRWGEPARVEVEIEAVDVRAVQPALIQEPAPWELKAAG